MSRIYFFQAGKGGPVKIGITSGPVARRRDNLQIGSAEIISDLGSYPGDRVAEDALHRRFAHVRMRGEWFRPDPELLALIADLAEPARGMRRVKHDHPLCRWRMQNCVTLQELAEKVGASHATMSRYETGARKPNVALLRKIEAITGISPRDLRPDIAKLLGIAA